MATTSEIIAQALQARQQRELSTSPMYQAGSALMTSKPQYNLGDPYANMAATIGQQILGGFLGGMGQGRAEQATNQWYSGVPNAVGQYMGGTLDASSPQYQIAGLIAEKQAEDQLNMQRAIQQAGAIEAYKQGLELQNAGPMQAAKDFAYLLDPRLRAQQGAQPGAVTTGIGVPEAGAARPGTVGSPLTDRLSKATAEILRTTPVDPKTASSMALETIKPELEATNAELKAAGEATDKARSMERVGNEVLSVLDSGKLGYTGPGASVSRGLEWLNKEIFDSQTSKDSLAARAVFDQISPDLISFARTQGSGAVSDYESKLFVGSGPQLTDTKEQIRLKAQALVQRGKREQDFQSFLQNYQQTNGTTAGAREQWKQFENANPILQLGMSKEGNGLIINDKGANADWRSFFGQQGSKPQQGNSAPKADPLGIRGL